MGRVERKWEKRRKRQLRVRRKIFGTPERPRLCVYRSLKHIYAQVVDDAAGRVLAAASSVSPQIRGNAKSGGNQKTAQVIGKKIAEISLAKGVSQVVFDRRGYKYHGRVKSLAEAARQNGLKF